MEYLNITLGQYWGVAEFEKLKNNFQYFIKEMTAKGLLSELVSLELWDDASHDMVLTEIQNLCTDVEKTTYLIDIASDWINDYSYYVDDDNEEDNPIHWREWEKKQANKYMLVKRWLDWMQYNHLIISGKEQKQQYLYSSVPLDSNSDVLVSEQIYDSSGEAIRTLEGYF